MKKYIQRCIKKIRRYPPVLLYGGGVVILILLLAIVSGIHRSVVSNSLKNSLHKIPQNSSSLLISGDGTARAFGFVVTSLDGNLINATGTFDHVPAKVVIMTDSGTTFQILNATSTSDDVEPGEIIIVTGTLRSLTPTIVISASYVRAVGIAGGAILLPPRPAPIPNPTAPQKSSTTAATSTAPSAPHRAAKHP